MMVGAALLLLLVLWPAVAQGETLYERFQRQHVDTEPIWEPDPSRYCNQMMQKRKMKVSCKTPNSFIHGTLAVITNVCGAGGTPCHDNYHYSKLRFNVTDCWSMKVQPNCSYLGHLNEKRICLACDNGEPVHYGRPVECSY